MTQEENILKMMRCLDISREEAIQLIEDDKKVDRMKDSEVNADLTKEQQQAVKKARQADRAPTVYKFTPRERKPNEDKRILLEQLVNAIGSSPIHAQCEITNQEREFLFTYNGIKYKVVLSAPRT